MRSERSVKVILLLSLVVGMAAGCLDSLVGSRCAEGLSVCEGRCVDLTSTREHCGACGVSCAGGCQAGMCTAGGDGGVAEGGALDGDGDGAGGDGSGDGSDGAIDAPVGPDAMVDGRRPDAPDPVDAAMDAGCALPRMTCAGACVSMESDPDNCGGCERRCRSGVCSAGACEVTGGVGHVILIGHDYVARNAGMGNLLGNAVFLAGTDPARVLVYEGAASRNAITGAHAAIDDVAKDTGRRWSRTTAPEDEVISLLPTHDVLLVHAQGAARDAELDTLGTEWRAALKTFVESGKTVVLLDGRANNNGGTHRLLSAAGLFTATARREATGETLNVVSAGDALATAVPRSYPATESTVAYETREKNVVVQTGSGHAVVVHEVF